MESQGPSNIPQTRKVFRVLSGIVAGIILLFSLPLSLYEAQSGSLQAIIAAGCCLYAGIGLANGAYTGRWFNSPG